MSRPDIRDAEEMARQWQARAAGTDISASDLRALANARRANVITNSEGEHLMLDLLAGKALPTKVKAAVIPVAAKAENPMMASMRRELGLDSGTGTGTTTLSASASMASMRRELQARGLTPREPAS